jgi:hypothetical protein
VPRDLGCYPVAIERDQGTFESLSQLFDSSTEELFIPSPGVAVQSGRDPIRQGEHLSKYFDCGRRWKQLLRFEERPEERRDLKATLKAISDSAMRADRTAPATRGPPLFAVCSLEDMSIKILEAGVKAAARAAHVGVIPDEAAHSTESLMLTDCITPVIPFYTLRTTKC